MSDQAKLDPIKLRVVSFPRGSTVRAVWALLLREFATSNTRASGGILWAFFTPIASIILLTVIFSSGFRAPPVGDVFAIYYATGIIPFAMFTSVSGQLGTCIQSNKRLLKYPRITVLDTVIARLIFTILVQIIVGFIIYTAILRVWDAKTVLNVALILKTMITAAVFGTGVGLVNLVVFPRFPSYQHIWGILTTPLFLVSCVIFPLKEVPPPFDAWLSWNPLVHFIEISRTGFYHGYHDHGLSLRYPFYLGVGLTVLGLIFTTQGRARLMAR